MAIPVPLGDLIDGQKLQPTRTSHRDPRVRSVVKFAAGKSSTILTDERKRLAQSSDRCPRCQFAFGKTQQALQFTTMTSNLLSSIQARL